MLDKLSELDESQLTELQNEIVSEFESVESEDPSPQTVDAMTSLADMLDSVRSEVVRREAEISELTTRAAEAAARVRGNADDTEQAAQDTPVEAEGEAEMPAEEETDKEKEDPAMTEASTATEKAAELSSEQPEQPTATTESVVEAAPVAEAAEMPAEAPVADEKTEEEAAPAEETPAEEAKEEKAEASTEVTELATAATAEAVAEPAKEAEAAASTSNETVEETAVETQEATTVTAAVNESDSLDIQAPADRRPTDRTTDAAPVAITAGADIPGYTAGASMNTMNDVADAFVKRLHGLRRVNGGDGEQHIVASLATTYPEDRQLTQDAEANWAKVQAVCQLSQQVFEQ